MALMDVFRRRRSGGDTGAQPGPRPADGVQDDAQQSAPDRDSDPGSVSSQRDVEGRGPVTLEDRTAKGGQASPDTNQGKAEPMPATPGEADPNAEFEPPSLEDMNVGGGDPQLASHQLARPRDVPDATAPVPRIEPGVAPPDDRPGIDADSTTKLPEGPERPAQASEGTAQRAPGSQGVSPEEQETDVQTGAANMRVGGGPAATPSPEQPGDSQEVLVPHDVPAPGTGEELPIAHGIRSPEQLPD